jgi:hypothetical protein
MRSDESGSHPSAATLVGIFQQITGATARRIIKTDYDAKVRRRCQPHSSKKDRPGMVAQRDTTGGCLWPVARAIQKPFRYHIATCRNHW